MFIRNLSIGIFFLGMILSVTGCSVVHPIETPSFQTMTKKDDVVARAVRSALVGRGWAIQSQQPGRIEAIYRKGTKFDATIAVSFNGGHVSIQHLNSRNLKYGMGSGRHKGSKVIHRNYNRWMRLLERDIQTHVAGA